MRRERRTDIDDDRVPDVDGRLVTAMMPRGGAGPPWRRRQGAPRASSAGPDGGHLAEGDGPQEVVGEREPEQHGSGLGESPDR